MLSGRAKEGNNFHSVCYFNFMSPKKSVGSISNLSSFDREFWSPFTFFMFPDVLLNLIVLFFYLNFSWRSPKYSIFCVWQTAINKKINLKATRCINMQMIQISFTFMMKVFNSRIFLTPNNFEKYLHYLHTCFAMMKKHKATSSYTTSTLFSCQKFVKSKYLID